MRLNAYYRNTRKREMTEELKKALFDSYCLGRSQMIDVIIEFMQSMKNNSEKDAQQVYEKITGVKYD